MRIRFLNTFIDNLTMNEAIDRIDCLAAQNGNSYVVTPNLDIIVQIEKDKIFRRICRNANLSLADGKPLIWISRLMGTPIKEKVSGSDLFPLLCERASQKGYSVYILGAAEGVAEKAARKLQRQFPKLCIAGTYSPPLGFEKNAEEVERIITQINDSNATILAVALGAPKGEKFIWQIKDRICANVCLQIGATIDFIAGEVKRAPKWMSDAGLEWFYRILQDPKRLLKRYMKDALYIIPILLKYTKKRQSDLRK